jgi:protein-tyrosine phosphatase
MPTRRLLTQGLYNARDLGGFPAGEGRVTKFQVFVRSEAPVGLPEGDLQYLRDYGVTASMDFRGTGEAAARPSDLAALLPYYHRPLFNEAAMAGSRPKPMPKKIGWGEQYISMAEESRDWAKDVLTIAAENPGVLLYHCTTGKDRTGLMSCYLLSIAGVPQVDIVADYCVSQLFLEPVYEKMRNGGMQLGPPPTGESAPPPMDGSFFETPASAMETLLGYLTEQYGGVVAYLQKIGVPEQVLRAIQEKFTEAP